MLMLMMMMRMILKMNQVLRLVVQKVMYENKIDFFVNPENTLPTPQIGRAGEPEVNNRQTASCCAQFTALLTGPEIDVPAGYNDIVYEPQYVDRKSTRLNSSH